MEWKYEAIDKLKKYEAKKNSLKSIPEEIQSLESQMHAIRSASADGNPVRGGGNGREDMLLSCICKQEELKESYRSAKRWIKLVDTALDILTEDERLILDRFYIHPTKGSVDKLCEELGLEKSAVYDRKSKALYRFTIALYGCSET